MTLETHGPSMPQAVCTLVAVLVFLSYIVIQPKLSGDQQCSADSGLYM